MTHSIRLNTFGAATGLAASLLFALVLTASGCDDEGLIGCWSDAEMGLDEPDDAGDSEDGRGAGTTRNDAGQRAATSGAGANACAASVPEAAKCELADGVTLPEDLTVDALGAARFYASGAELPAGRYRIAYVGGCISFEPSGRGWAVHGLTVDRGLAALGTNGESACWILGEGNALIAPTPGLAWRTVLADVDAGAVGSYDTLAQCEVANCRQPVIDFDFPGGKLGVRFGNSTSYVRLTGENVGGRSPTFRLTRLDPCP